MDDYLQKDHIVIGTRRTEATGNPDNHNVIVNVLLVRKPSDASQPTCGNFGLNWDGIRCVPVFLADVSSFGALPLARTRSLYARGEHVLVSKQRSICTTQCLKTLVKKDNQFFQLNN